MESEMSALSNSNVNSIFDHPFLLQTTARASVCIMNKYQRLRRRQDTLLLPYHKGEVQVKQPMTTQVRIKRCLVSEDFFKLKNNLEVAHVIKKNTN